MISLGAGYAEWFEGVQKPATNTPKITTTFRYFFGSELNG